MKINDENCPKCDQCCMCCIHDDNDCQLCIAIKDGQLIKKNFLLANQCIIFCPRTGERMVELDETVG